MAWSTIARADASSATFVLTKDASPPASLASRTVSSPAPSLYSATTTLEPSAANMRAATRPMPEPPPVMIETLSLSRIGVSWADGAVDVPGQEPGSRGALPSYPSGRPDGRGREGRIRTRSRERCRGPGRPEASPAQKPLTENQRLVAFVKNTVTPRQGGGSGTTA